MARLTVYFTTDLGAQVSVEVDEEDLYKTLRHYGQRGWYSGELPPSGFVLPRDQESFFDWSLLAGRRLSDETVWCRGHTWTRRERGDSVVYLRPALAYDPPLSRHTLEDDHEYILLAVFTELSEGSAVSTPEPSLEQPLGKLLEQPSPEPYEPISESPPPPPPPGVDERVLKMRENIGKLLDQLRAQGKELDAEEVMHRHGFSLTETEDVDLGRQVYKELRALFK